MNLASLGSRRLGIGVRACALLVLAVALSGPVSADIESEVLNGVVVDQAWASPAAAGSKTRLSFRIDNRSGRNLILDDVSSGSAEAAQFFMSENSLSETPVDELFIPDQEVLNLDSSHLSVELIGLRRELRPGQTFDFELVFRTGRAPARAHIHAASDVPPPAASPADAGER